MDNHSNNGRGDALQAIRAVMVQAFEQDAWTPGLIAAFDILVKDGLPPGMARAFRQALDLPDPAARATCTLATYELICRHLGHPDPTAGRAQRAQHLRRSAANDARHPPLPVSGAGR